jgi:hypothetical protein
VDGSFSVGSFFRQKSNEAQHKVKFGQLGTQMLNLGVTELDDIRDLYKAMADETAYPDPGPGPGPGDPPGFESADGIIGGRMFDQFWASETGWDFGANEDHFSGFSNFYRCKQCHGWDLLGNAGAYISRAPRTSRPNVSSVNLKEHAAEHTPQELFDDIMQSTGRRNLDADLASYDPDTNSTVGDQMPNFSEFMTDAQVWDLVKFLKEQRRVRRRRLRSLPWGRRNGNHCGRQLQRRELLPPEVQRGPAQGQVRSVGYPDAQPGGD